MGSLNFNAADHVPVAGDFEPVPAGCYACTIQEAEWVDSDTAGRGIKLKLEVDASVHPDIGARCFFDRLWINNPKPAKPGKRSGREIANGMLSSICHAINRLELDEPDDLLGGMLAVSVKVRPATEQYPADNEVTGYKPYDKATGPAPVPGSKPMQMPKPSGKANAAAKPAPAAAANSGGRKPWGQK